MSCRLFTERSKKNCKGKNNQKTLLFKKKIEGIWNLYNSIQHINHS